jgi:hypothetical protein
MDPSHRFSRDAYGAASTKTMPLLGRYSTVSGFLKLLPDVICFGANAEGAPVLAAMRALPGVLACRSRLPAPLIPGRLADADVM